MPVYTYTPPPVCYFNLISMIYLLHRNLSSIQTYISPPLLHSLRDISCPSFVPAYSLCCRYVFLYVHTRILFHFITPTVFVGILLVIFILLFIIYPSTTTQRGHLKGSPQRVSWPAPSRFPPLHPPPPHQRCKYHPIIRPWHGCKPPS